MGFGAAPSAQPPAGPPIPFRSLRLHALLWQRNGLLRSDCDGYGPPVPHLHRGWAHPCLICISTQTWAHPCHICIRTGLTDICIRTRATSARDWAHPCHGMAIVSCSSCVERCCTLVPGVGGQSRNGLRRSGVAFVPQEAQQRQRLGHPPRAAGGAGRRCKARQWPNRLGRIVSTVQVPAMLV